MRYSGPVLRLGNTRSALNHAGALWNMVNRRSLCCMVGIAQSQPEKRNLTREVMNWIFHIAPARTMRHNERGFTMSQHVPQWIEW